MNINVRKSIALLLAVLMFALTLAGCGGRTAKEEEQENGGRPAEIPDYLNVESPYPVIKDEYKGTIKLKAAIVQGANGGEWDHVWLSKYLREKYNIELEVESIQESALYDKKNLMFASGDLPDLMLNMALYTGELNRYGCEELRAQLRPRPPS